jgi:hypothetical protein
VKLLYLAGPITGVADYRERFQQAADKLRADGYAVINPAENAPQPDWRSYMTISLTQLCTAEGAAMLPGWEKSKGAFLEHHVAVNLGMPIIYL